MEENQTYTGTIKRIKPEGGFGFIAIDDGNDVFFHATGVANRQFSNLNEGDRVSFELFDSLNPKTKVIAPAARNVQIIS